MTTKLANDATATHATAIRLHGQGILFRGPSGSGKSRLAMALLDGSATHFTIKLATDQAHQPAEPLPLDQGSTALIGDDYLHLTANGEDLMASPAKALEGLIELRGLGILTTPWCAQAPIHLVVELVAPEKMERLPQREQTTMAGKSISQLNVPVGDLAHQLLLVRMALQTLLADR